MAVSPISDELIKQINVFCEICVNVRYYVCQHRALFDDNPHKPSILERPWAGFWERLSFVTSEYALLQIAKLHDSRAFRVKGEVRQNLTLRYFSEMEVGCWSDEDATALKVLEGRMTELIGKFLTPARNRLLAHNDLDECMAERQEKLGAFGEDGDIEYFQCLQSFVNILFNYTKFSDGRYSGGIYPLEISGDENDFICFVDFIAHAQMSELEQDFCS